MGALRPRPVEARLAPRRAPAPWSTVVCPRRPRVQHARRRRRLTVVLPALLRLGRRADRTRLVDLVGQVRTDLPAFSRHLARANALRRRVVRRRCSATRLVSRPSRCMRTRTRLLPSSISSPTRPLSSSHRSSAAHPHRDKGLPRRRRTPASRALRARLAQRRLPRRRRRTARRAAHARASHRLVLRSRLALVSAHLPRADPASTTLTLVDLAARLPLLRAALLLRRAPPRPRRRRRARSTRLVTESTFPNRVALSTMSSSRSSTASRPCPLLRSPPRSGWWMTSNAASTRCSTPSTATPFRLLFSTALTPSSKPYKQGIGRLPLRFTSTC